MRPVNLIPPEDRRGDRAPLRAGSLSYIVVGAFAAALVAVVAMVLTQNSITDRENEIAELEIARDAAAQQAEELAPYAEFATLQAQRETTIASLAESRFDWERVLRELALVIPGDVTLDALEASTSGEGSEGATETTGVGSAPSLVMDGCGTGHESVAAFVAALEDIDGVTRVGLDNSVRSGADAGSGAGGGATGPAAASPGAASCGPKSTTFTVTAVFDGFAPPDPAAAGTTPPAGATPPAPPAVNSAEEQVGEAEDAAGLVTGTAR